MKRAPLLLSLSAALAFGPLGCAHSGSGSRLSALDQAKVALDRGDAKAALPALKEAHQKSPDDLDLARMLVEASVKSGESAQLAASLASDQTTPPAVRRYMQGLLHFADPATAGTQAIDDFREAARLAPTRAELHYRYGLALLESERYAEALPELQRAAQLDPERTAVRLPLAKALERTGHPDDAVAALRQVVHGSPSPGEVQIARALMNEIADPFANFPDAARGKLERGMAWMQNADVPQEAIVQFEEILRDFPDLAVVHALLGLSYERLDDAGRAVDEFKRAIELAPRVGKNWLYLGELYLSHQRSDAAKDAFEKALALDPLLDGAYLHLGDLALDRHDFDTAQSLFGALSALEPDAVPPKGKLSLALQMSGDWAGAAKVLRSILEKEPENPEFLLRLGLLQTERAQKAPTRAEKDAARKEATEALEKVLSQQPDNAIASRALQELKR